MSKDFGKTPLSGSAWMIRKAMRRYQKMSQEEKIDLMVKSKALTPEQAERAKKKWAEIQAAKESS